ncbi:hypothetical protein AB0L53_04580 [Nonomuraea sp. NPDC052129]|uniref:phosphotransferase family protein n=1 Tax=Nonomuraea sp. NPDC052129 TaxID=3154651 RepID=UPI003412158B
MWNAGPFGEDARRLIVESAESIAGWASRYTELAEKALAAFDRWVPTHGEPHHANQLLTDSGLVLVDWESFALAPPERDLLNLPEHDRRALGGEPEMIELFELEWRLTEIREYARWFQAPHTGSENDRTRSPIYATSSHADAARHESLVEGALACPTNTHVDLRVLIP